MPIGLPMNVFLLFHTPLAFFAFEVAFAACNLRVDGGIERGGRRDHIQQHVLFIVCVVWCTS